jgi:hypothetical protein
VKKKFFGPRIFVCVTGRKSLDWVKKKVLQMPRRRSGSRSRSGSRAGSRSRSGSREKKLVEDVLDNMPLDPTARAKARKSLAKCVKKVGGKKKSSKKGRVTGYIRFTQHLRTQGVGKALDFGDRSSLFAKKWYDLPQREREYWNAKS